MVPELSSELDPRSSALTPLGFEYGASKIWKERRAELYGAPGKYRSCFCGARSNPRENGEFRTERGVNPELRTESALPK